VVGSCILVNAFTWYFRSSVCKQAKYACRHVEYIPPVQYANKLSMQASMQMRAFRHVSTHVSGRTRQSMRSWDFVFTGCVIVALQYRCNDVYWYTDALLLLTPEKHICAVCALTLDTQTGF
jgi:hypothetical protein